MATRATTQADRPIARGLNDEEALFNHIRKALRDLQFGTVVVVVQNGRVVQIERHEKTRLGQPDNLRPETD